VLSPRLAAPSSWRPEEAIKYFIKDRTSRRILDESRGQRRVGAVAIDPGSGRRCHGVNGFRNRGMEARCAQSLDEIEDRVLHV